MIDDKISAGLASIRRRRIQAWALFWGYLPAVLLATSTARALGFQGETIPFYAALTWMAFFAVASWRAGWARCPRCGNWFSARRRLAAIWGNPFARRCLHCGLHLRSSCSTPPIEGHETDSAPKSPSR